MNGKAIGETIEDIASSISNSKWAKSIIPTMDELNQTMTKNISSSKKFLDEQAQLGVKKALQSIGGLSVEESETISKNISSKNLDESVENLRDTLSKSIPSNRNIDKVLNGVKASAKEQIDNPDISDVLENMNNFEKYSHYPKAYFTNPNKNIRNTRIGTAVGAYAALSVGGRYLRGGTLTTDQYGRKDIAGIPFL